MLGYPGLKIVDITAPENLAVVRDLPIAGGPSSVAVDGDHAFVTNSSGLLSLDLALPDSVIWDGGSSAPIQAATSVALSGNYAFVAADSMGLVVVDNTGNELPHCTVPIVIQP